MRGLNLCVEALVGYSMIILFIVTGFTGIAGGIAGAQQCDILATILFTISLTCFALTPIFFCIHKLSFDSGKDEMELIRLRCQIDLRDMQREWRQENYRRTMKKHPEMAQHLRGIIL